MRSTIAEALKLEFEPVALYREMEANVSGSFFERPVWRKLAENKGR